MYCKKVNCDGVTGFK